MFNIGSLTRVVVSSANRGVLIASKYAPEILTGTGVVGVVGTAILASKATLNLSPIVESARNDIELINHVVETHGPDSNEPYTQKEKAVDLSRVYVRTFIQTVKLYAPTLIVGSLSIACLIGSTRILRGRNLAVAAAYAALETQYNKYRQRVIEDLGKDRDDDYRLGLREEKIEVIKDGKVAIEKVKLADPGTPSQYARFFDETSSQWQRDAESNLIFLRGMQNHANDRLRAKGSLFLNEVYDMLGIARSKEGSVVGWILSKDFGDNFVDFGIYDVLNGQRRAFVNGLERSILLDFNVDGLIFDKLA